MTEIVLDFCICKGQTRRATAGAAHIIVESKEYRVYFHKSCLTDETKKVVSQALKVMADKDSITA